MPPPLTVERLLASGFEVAGCWSAKEHRIDPPLNLPAQRGVYAFALGEQVVYVGLASRSVKQRLGFYARPGQSQRTNIRLNAMIAELIGQGQTVRVLIAHPDDSEWNGLRSSGPEGLEAALIEDFDLSWNMRGSTSPVEPAPTDLPMGSGGRRVHGTTPQAILDFVAAHPKCTELQIAKGVFGPSAVQPRANQYCRRLVAEGKLKRLETRPVRYVIQK